MKKNLMIGSILLFSFVLLQGCAKEDKTDYLKSESSLLAIVDKDKEGRKEIKQKKTQFSLSFPNGMKEGIVEMPFLLSIKLPSDWNILEARTAPFSLISPYNIYDGEQRYVGFAGYRNYDLNEVKEKEKSANIFKDFALDYSGKVDIVNSYQVVNSTYQGNTAVVDIIYYELKNKNKTKVNHGILAFNRDFAAIVFLEFDSKYLNKTEVEEIAKSLIIK